MSVPSPESFQTRLSNSIESLFQIRRKSIPNPYNVYFKYMPPCVVDGRFRNPLYYYYYYYIFSKSLESLVHIHRKYIPNPYNVYFKFILLLFEIHRKSIPKPYNVYLKFISIPNLYRASCRSYHISFFPFVLRSPYRNDRTLQIQELTAFFLSFCLSFLSFCLSFLSVSF